MVVDVCPTLRAGGNSTGGDRPPGTDVDTADSLIALSVALRGRDGGATAELGGEVAGTLRASTGGGDKAHVLAPIAFDSRQDPVSSTEVFGALGSSSPQAQAVTYAIQAGALRTNPNSGPDGMGVQSDHAYTLEARAEVQAVAIMENQRGELRVSDRCNALTSGGGKPGQGYPAAMIGMAVRRLTPTECARLQGFEDNYLSQVMVRGKPMADGPMYKALGNSWAVPNVSWIGRRIYSMLTKGHV